MSSFARARTRAQGLSVLASSVALVALSSLAAGCGPGGSGSGGGYVASGSNGVATIGSGAQYALLATSGDGQHGIRGAFLSVPLAISVQNAASKPVAGVPVTFEVTEGDAGVTVSRSYSDAQGRAVTFVILGQTVGTNTIVATAGGSQVTFTETTTEYVASTLVVDGFPTKIVSGTPGTFTVTARDSQGRLAVAYNGTVSFSSSDPAAQLASSYTFQASDKGTHTFSATLQTVGTWSIGATDTADKTITGTETPIVVIPRPVAALSVSGVADPLTSGAVSDVVVKALYADGTVDPYYTGSVTFSTSDPSGTVTLPTTYTFTAADMGVHRFSQSVRLQTAGTQTITATDAGHALAASQPVTVSPSLRVTSFTSTKAAVKGTSMLSWTVSGAPTKLTLDPGGIDETGKTTDTATPFPAAPSVINPHAFYRLTAMNAASTGRVAELGSAAAIGGTTDDQACAAAAFPDGGAVVTGYFTGTAMLGTTFLSSLGGKDVFVARYNADGSLAWATSAGGSGDDAGLGVAAFADGTCVVTGYFSGTATFGKTTLTSSGGRDAFVASFKADGTVAWAVSAGGTGDDVGQAVAGFLDGSVTVAGSFSGTASFGSSASVSSTGSTDIFVARYSVAGKLLWVRSAGGSGDDAALGVSIRPDGNSILTGSYQAGATFGSISLPSSSGTSGFVACYRTDGVVAWAKSIAATGDVSGASSASFPDGSCAVTGRFTGSASFDASTTIVSAGGTDAFLVRYAQDGTVVWALPAGGTGDDSGSAVAALPDGSAVVGGTFRGTATFSSSSLVSQGGADAFLACYDATGALVWAKSAGGAGDDAALGVAACNDGSSWLAGSFSGTATFGPGVTLASAGSTDAFTARFAPVNYLLQGLTPHGFAGATGSSSSTTHGMTVGGVVALADGSTLATGYYTATAPITFGAATLPANSGVTTPFLVRFNPDCTVAWATTVTVSDPTYAYSVAAYADGTCVVVGDLGANPAVFSPSITLSSGGMFLARYATDGTCTSATAYPGVDTYAKHVCAFADGSCAVAGSTYGADFGGGYTVSLMGLVEAYVVHVKTDGSVDWLQASAGTDYGYGIGSTTTATGIAALPDGSCIVAGGYSISTKIGSTTLSEGYSVSNPDQWVAKFEADGTFDWAKSTVMGDFAYAYNNGMSAAPDGSCVTCGYMLNDMTFGKGETNETTLSASAYSPYIAKYNSDGTLAWAKMATPGTSGRATGVAAFSDGSSVVSGWFTGSIDFGSGVSLTSSVVTYFVARYDSDGSIAWADAGVTSYGTGKMNPVAAAFLDGSCAIVGRFRTSMTLGSGQPAATTLSGGTTDTFFGKYFDP